MAQNIYPNSQIVHWIPPVQFPPLPNDVIVEIFTWLPVKTLLKFNCVCKSWRALISSPKFIRAHLENSKLHPNLAHDVIAFNCGGNLMRCSVNSMLYESVSEVFDLSHQFESLYKFRMLSSCNGLVLLTVDKENLFLWNPSTRTCKKLPHIGVEVEYDSGYLCYGLGYAESGDDYKVVGFLCRNYNVSEVIVLVFSFRNDQWKRIKDIDGRYVYAGRAAFANGKLYWISYLDYQFGLGWYILCLDLDDEYYEILQMPSYVKISYPSSLKECGGSLYLLCNHETHVDLWILDGCSVGVENWTKVVTIPSCPNRCWVYYHTMLLYVLKNGVVMFCNDKEIFIYDAKDCSFRCPPIRNSGGSSYAGIRTYIESLVSPVGWL